MPNDDDWIEEAHKRIEDAWRRSPGRTDWIDLKVAANHIREYTGLRSTGAAQVVLHRACSSEEVRSRGWTSRSSWDYGDLDIPLTAADWVGAAIELKRTSLYKSQDTGRLIIPRVAINLTDLEWWLRNRWNTGAAPGDPASAHEQPSSPAALGDPAAQAQRDNGVNAGISRGKQGRKSKGKDLYLAEFDRLYGNKADLPPVPEIADRLADWLRVKHPDIKQPSIQTIKNRLWERLRNNTTVHR